MDEKSYPSTSSFAIRVAKPEGEKIIDELKEKELFDNSRVVVAEGDSLWIPIKKEIAGARRKNLPLKRDSSLSLKEKFGIRSFDTIGDIIVVFIPDELAEKKYEIGQYLLNLYPHVKAVYKETAKAQGIFRIQSKELIAGQGSETIHREHGLQFKLDVTKVFFSPRQITERMALTNYPAKGDKVCVCFSGIGAIPIYLSKFTEVTKIIGIELNQTAHQYASENLELNNVQNVQLINGDVSRVVPKLAQKEKFDLVIMPLPKQAASFLASAEEVLTITRRLVISIVGSNSKIDHKVKELEAASFTIQKVRKERNIAPKEYRYTIYAKKRKQE